MWQKWGEEGRMQDLVEKPERKGPHVITRCRWEYNVNMDLPEMEWGDID